MSPATFTTGSYSRHQRLVDLEAVRGDQIAVNDDLVAGPDLEDVVKDNFADGDLPNLALPHRPGPGGRQDGELVQRSLSLRSCTDANKRVCHTRTQPNRASWIGRTRITTSSTPSSALRE